MAFPNTPIINGEKYSWAKVRILMDGLPKIGINAINYSDEQAIEAEYGAGDAPVGYRMGDIAYEGSVTLHKEEVELLQLAAPNGRLQEIAPFDIVVSYAKGNGIAIHTLQSCKFKNNSRSPSRDSAMEIEINLFIGGIKWTP